MEDPSFPTHPPDHPKRMFAGGSSSGGSPFVDSDVIEIPPPSTWKPKRHKHNSIIHHEVIDVDDEDSDDIVIINEKIAPSSKGKKPMLNHATTKATSSTDATIIGGDFHGIDLTDISYDDDCVMLQAHFDSLDVPTGIEATVPWWPGTAGNHLSSSSSFSPQFYSPYFEDPTPKVDEFQSWSSLQASQAKHLSKYCHRKPKPYASGLPIHPGFHGGMIPQMPSWQLPPFPKHHFMIGSSSEFSPFQDKYMENWENTFHSSADPVTVHSAAAAAASPLNSFFSEFGSGFPIGSAALDDDICAQISPPSTSGQEGDGEHSLLKKLETFKKFVPWKIIQTIYTTTLPKNLSSRRSKSWGKTIAEEWRMLEKDLPDTIFVRVYEARMDLLRAVIVGADGTPYHDGLFFFDVNFTGAYPKSPPHVKYHAHGLRINPNLYNCGKVCLSLLGTWSGSGAENWRPGKSNMLQVLVSIQGLILNAEPYYNEPGYANSKNSSRGNRASKEYSENTLLLSLKTMLYTMRNPPKKFEDLVFGHFYKRAHDILAACRAYLDGVEVGTFEKGIDSAAKTKRSTCSNLLKSSLPGCIKNLVTAFTKIGVKDCEKYLVSPDNGLDHLAESSKSTRKRRRR